MIVSNLGLISINQTFRKAWKNQKEENEMMDAYFSSLLEKYGLVLDENDRAMMKKMGFRFKGTYASS
jgi:hypothetical protein